MAGYARRFWIVGLQSGQMLRKLSVARQEKDFVNKLQIAYKEARETRYWLRLLREGEMLERKLADSFLKDCNEILAILASILNSSKGGNS